MKVVRDWAEAIPCGSRYLDSQGPLKREDSSRASGTRMMAGRQGLTSTRKDPCCPVLRCGALRCPARLTLCETLGLIDSWSRRPRPLPPVPVDDPERRDGWRGDAGSLTGRPSWWNRDRVPHANRLTMGYRRRAGTRWSGQMGPDDDVCDEDRTGPAEVGGLRLRLRLQLATGVRSSLMNLLWRLRAVPSTTM